MDLIKKYDAIISNNIDEPEGHSLLSQRCQTLTTWSHS